MFKNKTVFILGAGASWHYGYPTGEELVRQVIERAATTRDLLIDNTRISPVNMHAPEYIGRNTNVLPSEDVVREQWQYAARECADLVDRLQRNNPLVIDYFLAQNPRLQDIGKLMIAWVLLDCEAKYIKQRGNINRREILLASPRKQDREEAVGLDLTKFKDDWYRFLLYKLTDGCGTSARLHENQVTFITFNYDTSIEHRISDGLRALDMFDRNDIRSFLSEDRVLHVYGKLRLSAHSEEFTPLDFTPFEITTESVATYRDKSDLRRSDQKTLLDAIYRASKGIRTIDPDDKALDERILQVARKAIKEAACVYILGYGFNRLNSERLGLDESLRLDKSHSHRSVLFTNLGDSNRINKLASMLFFGKPDHVLSMEKPYLGGLQDRFYCEKSTRNVYDALALDFDALEQRFTAGTAI